jgi:hypothetical protein
MNLEIGVAHPLAIDLRMLLGIDWRLGVHPLSSDRATIVVASARSGGSGSAVAPQMAWRRLDS